LQNNFDAQVFAFRKMREKLLMEENPAKMYKKDKSMAKGKGERTIASMDEKELKELLSTMSKG
jgi:hypothetical protein